MSKQPFIEAGRVVNTHGVRGEVKVEVWLDSPAFMRRFKTWNLDGRSYKVLSARPQKDFLLAKLEGVEDVNAAMALKGRTVRVDRAEAKLPEGSFFLQDILGARVQTETGEPVGILEDILETPANRVYVVKGETEHLIPAVPEFILSTDPEAGLITVRLIGGM